MNIEAMKFVSVEGGTDYLYAIVGEPDAYTVETVKVWGDASCPVANSGMRRDIDNACVAEDGATLTELGLSRVRAMVAQTLSDNPKAS